MTTVTLEFALAYARMNQQQRDAVRDNLGRPLVVVGELEWACLRALADEVDRLKESNATIYHRLKVATEIIETNNLTDHNILAEEPAK